MKEYFYLKKGDKEDILFQITSLLQKRPEVVFAYCHGTFLTKKIGFRDIDIALYLKKKPREVFDYQEEIAEILEREIKYPVDLKVLNVAPFYFLNSVFRTGRLLFTRNEKLLTELIEKSSLESIVNYNFSLSSLWELIS